MKTQIQTLVTSLASLVDQLPVDPPRVFVLQIPRSDAATQYFSGILDMNNPQDWPNNAYPGAVYDSGINTLTLISPVKPTSLDVVASFRDDAGNPKERPEVVEWQDMGIYDPMIEATATITRLQETEVVLREEITRQANRIVALEAEILRLNTAIDAAQNPDPVQA
jgi:hypothetical protein